MLAFADSAKSFLRDNSPSDFFVASRLGFPDHPAYMWPFASKTQEKLELAAEPRIDRVEETRSRVAELKAQLAALDAEMLRFKTKNRIQADRFGRLLGIQCATVNGRAAIEREWRALLRQRDGLLPAFHRALFDWSQAKEVANK